MGDVDVESVGDAVALHVDHLSFVDGRDARPLGTRDLGHVVAVAFHAPALDGKVQVRRARGERGSRLVALGEFLQFGDGRVELLLLPLLFAQYGLFARRHALQACLGVALVAFVTGPLGVDLAACGVERLLLRGEQLLLPSHLLRCLGDLAQLRFAQFGHAADVGDATRHVGEILRGEDIGQVAVLLVVAVGFAYHRRILGAVAFQPDVERTGRAVARGELFGEQRQLAFGFVEQLAARCDLPREPPHALLFRILALLDRGELLFAACDLLFERIDGTLLLGDLPLQVALLPCCRNGQTEQQAEDQCEACHGAAGVCAASFRRRNRSTIASGSS